MNIQDKATATLRTLWPALIAHVVAVLVSATEPLGLNLDGALATQATGWALFAVLYLVGRWLESRTGDGLPARGARFVGAVLLGSTRQPVYTETPAATETRPTFE